MTRQYDFQNLSFDDFELLANDLLTCELEVRFESFRTGRDEGIDLRYAPSEDRTTIVQCKRFASAAFPRLLRVIRDDEVPKIKLHDPDRYILVTSCNLSPANKAQLLAVLTPYSLVPGDILGANEINALLRKHSEVERKHFKLWMGSTEILERVLQAGIFNYSLHEVSRLRQELSRYVVHEGFYRALGMLDAHHHCVILGMPGIGKTTAARLLLAHYLREDFQIVSVSGDIEEAWRVIDAENVDKKLVVYYDDFLGQIGHSQKLGKNEDRRLLGLLEHCRDSKTKRFILTTREYLFDQALDEHEPLSRVSEEIRRSTVKLDDYTQLVRARLLINHLTFSNIPAVIIENLVRSETCTALIKHPNFLPRIIEGICSDSFLSGKTSQTFAKAAIERLEDPASVWRHPFQQLTREAQLLLYALASLDGVCEKSNLERAYAAMRGGSDAIKIPRYFNDVLHEVEGSFTISQRYPARAGKTTLQATWMVRFINPSAREYVLTDAVSRREVLDLIFNNALDFRQTLFWQEARKTFDGAPVGTLVRGFATRWFAQGLHWIMSLSPELCSWPGNYVEFQPAVSVVSRLRTLLEAAASVEVLEQQEAEIINYLGSDSTQLQKLFSSFDVFWLPEVTRTLIDVLRRSSESWRATLTDLFSAIEPGPYGTDLRMLGYHWEATQEVIDALGLDAEETGLVRSKFVLKAEEATDEITEDLSSGEIEEAGSSLEVLESILESSLYIRREALEKFKETAVSREEFKENEAKAEELSEAYGRQNDAPPELTDTDALFEELLVNLE